VEMGISKCNLSSSRSVPTSHLSGTETDGQDDFIQSRSTAIESIESTISELGQIFSQLAGMVAEQRETVQRIDADTTDIAAYVPFLLSSSSLSITLHIYSFLPFHVNRFMFMNGRKC
jgi:hypothetical protein